jgi:hypothetical protein
MSQRNNFKTENNNSEEEIESFNEEEEENDLFMNKKELVHIENDTSINVDKSFDDDHSKTSTIKKGGLIINNISAINEQFSKDLDLSDKKIVDQNFFNKKIKTEIEEYNDFEIKTVQKGLNNLKQNQNELKINPTNYFDTFNSLALEENDNSRNNLQNNNNILNNTNINKKNQINNDNFSKNYNKFSISNFNCSYLSPNNKAIDQTKSNYESKTQYNQLESNFFNLSEQYKKLKEDYEEINNSNKSLLDLLSYWQKFYLEIKEIVLPEVKKNNNDFSINDYMDDPYRIQVIDEVKKLIIISRDKAYNNFFKVSDINFEILKDRNNKNNELKNLFNNLIQKRVESFNIKNEIIKLDDANENINELKISKKFLDESDDIDLPPIRYNIEKINIGVNTDNKYIECEKNLKFDSNLLLISKNINKLELKGLELKKINPQKQENQFLKDESSNFYLKNKIKEFKVLTIENMNIKGKPKLPTKFKKNTTFKFACIQTDISKEKINDLILFKDKNELIQKQLEDKINTLNEIINNTEKKNNFINKNISLNKTKNNKENKSPNKNNHNNSKIFLPEMIPPENTYKIFMNCIKNFKYEEGIYQKFIIEDDIIILKNFVEKMEKYLIGTSLPILKATKRKDYIIHSKKNIQLNNIKKYKEIILSSNRPKYSNITNKKRNTSDSKNYYERSNSVVNNNTVNI